MSAGRPIELPEPWLTLATRAGGAGELCEALSVSRSTLARWAAGVVPGPHVRAAVNAYARERGVRRVWV